VFGNNNQVIPRAQGDTLQFVRVEYDPKVLMGVVPQGLQAVADRGLSTGQDQVHNVYKAKCERQFFKIILDGFQVNIWGVGLEEIVPTFLDARIF